MPRQRLELTLVPLAEGALLLALGAIAIFLKLPLLITSLGPTAYEQIEKPSQKSSTPYNIIVGHFVAVAAALASLYLLGGLHSPSESGTSDLTFIRLAESVTGCFMTAFLNLVLRSSQPAAFATTMLITLGNYQSPRAILSIVLGVLILTILGEPLRRISLRLRAEHSP